MNANGSGLRKVTNLPTYPKNPYAPFNYTWLLNGRHLLYHNKLIDVGTGNIAEFHFPFDPVSATWFMPTEKQSILLLPTSHCADGWSRLSTGIYAIVTVTVDDPPNRVRKSPTRDAEVVTNLYPGTIVKVISGPICAGGLVFWQVEHASIPDGAGWDGGRRRERDELFPRALSALTLLTEWLYCFHTKR